MFYFHKVIDFFCPFQIYNMGDTVKLISNYDGLKVPKGSVESLVTLGREKYKVKSTDGELAREKSGLKITGDLASIIKKQKSVSSILYYCLNNLT